jgi:large repetitive protein
MRGRRLAVIGAATLLLALAGSAPAVAAPNASLNVALAPGSPAPPVLNQTYAYSLALGNTGDVALDSLVIVDTLPVELALSSVTTGTYSGLTDIGPGEGVRVSYEKNTAPGVFTLWGSSPNTTTNTTLTAPPPGLGAGSTSRACARSTGRRPRACGRPRRR